MSEENKEGAAGDQGASDGAAGGNNSANSANDTLDAVIGAYVATAKQLPGVIPELISGKNLNEVNASIDTSKAAFKRVAESVKPADGAAGGADGKAQPAPVPVVGTGASAAAAGEQPKLSSSAGFDKILAGVEGKGKQSR